MEVPRTVPQKPKRYYLPLSLSVDDIDNRLKRWQKKIKQRKESNDIKYFDAELFMHTAKLHPSACPQLLSGNRNVCKELQKLTRSKPITGNNRVKQAGSFPKLSSPLHFPKLPRSLISSSSASAQMFRKSYEERAVDVKSRKELMLRNFPATKHISLLSQQATICDENFESGNFASHSSTDPETGSGGSGCSTSAEQRLKSTLAASAEKLRHVFYKAGKWTEGTLMTKEDRFDCRAQSMKCVGKEDCGMSYI